MSCALVSSTVMLNASSRPITISTCRRKLAMLKCCFFFWGGGLQSILIERDYRIQWISTKFSEFWFASESRPIGKSQLLLHYTTNLVNCLFLSLINKPENDDISGRSSKRCYCLTSVWQYSKRMPTISETSNIAVKNQVTLFTPSSSLYFL
jgi:hypothetical protein